jgi:hypothetical protein
MISSTYKQAHRQVEIYLREITRQDKILAVHSAHKGLAGAAGLSECNGWALCDSLSLEHVLVGPFYFLMIITSFIASWIRLLSGCRKATVTLTTHNHTPDETAL